MYSYSNAITQPEHSDYAMCYYCYKSVWANFTAQSLRNSHTHSMVTQPHTSESIWISGRPGIT
jgi:hypothetical protein